MRQFFVFFFLFISLLSSGRTVKIGLFNTSSFEGLILRPEDGNFLIFSEGRKILHIDPKSSLKILAEGNSFTVKLQGNVVGKFQRLKLMGERKDKSLYFKSITGAEFIYSGNFDITAKSGVLKIVNYVNLEDYVSGVVESEIGNASQIEYLKVQAVISRTYALSHLNRHEGEGFDLCDQVHCQVYKSKSHWNSLIPQAVEATKEKVITDKDQHPIIAAFHSNCGGITCNSEDVWSSNVPYLRSVSDSFCVTQAHAAWNVKISRAQWVDYLQKYDREGILKTDSLADFSLDTSDRSSDYHYKGISIPTKTIRSDWKLKSTLFKIRQEQDTLVFQGKGFGHGVGLCQEGAMEMASKGFTFEDIISFYYRDVLISDESTIDFLSN